MHKVRNLFTRKLGRHILPKASDLFQRQEPSMSSHLLKKQNINLSSHLCLSLFSWTFAVLYSCWAHKDHPTPGATGGPSRHDKVPWVPTVPIGSRQTLSSSTDGGSSKKWNSFHLSLKDDSGVKDELWWTWISWFVFLILPFGRSFKKFEASHGVLTKAPGGGKPTHCKDVQFPFDNWWITFNRFWTIQNCDCM